MEHTSQRPGLRRWLVAYLLVKSVIVTVIGVLLVVRPHDTVQTLARFVGWILVVLAVIDLIAAASPGPDRQTRRLLVLRALLTGAIGAVMVVLTDVTVTAVAVLIGMHLVVSGGVNVLMSLQLKRRIEAWLGLAARGSLALAAGIAALVWPSVTILVVAMILGVQWIIGGLVSTATAVAIATRE